MFSTLQKKTERLEKIGDIERKKTERLEKMVDVERKKTERLEKSGNELEKKVMTLDQENVDLKELVKWHADDMVEKEASNRELKKGLREEHQKRMVLEDDVADLKQSTGAIAEWIVAGVSPYSSF